MEIDINKNKERYINLLRNTGRDGVEDLIKWLETTDFFEAPASSRFHLSEAGGLCVHSLHVYEEMKRLIVAYPEIDVPEDSMVIMTLCHDLCKANFYSIEMRNAKNPDTGKWEQVPYYSFNEIEAFGYHGPKSCRLVERCMRMTDLEWMAIANHMGGFSEKPENVSKVYETSPIAWLLHVADESATYVREVEA